MTKFKVSVFRDSTVCERYSITVEAESEEAAMILAEEAVKNDEAELQDTDHYNVTYEADENSVTPV